MAWRELLQTHHLPVESLPNLEDMASLQAGAEADLREAYEPHMDAQMVFWNAMTAFLGRGGRLMHRQPNFDRPCFSTGWMALEEPGVNDHGETRPIPAVQIQTSEYALIWNYFRDQAEHPSLKRRWFPPQPEELRQERIEQVRTAVREHVNGFGYIDINTAMVSFLCTREPKIDWRASSIKGAYIPSVLLKTRELPILPGLIPSNEWKCDSPTSVLRVHAPKPPKLRLPSFCPAWQSPDTYKKSLHEKVDDAIKVRNQEIENLGEMVDILQTAERIDFSVDDHFERLYAKR